MGDFHNVTKHTIVSSSFDTPNYEVTTNLVSHNKNSYTDKRKYKTSHYQSLKHGSAVWLSRLKDFFLYYIRTFIAQKYNSIQATKIVLKFQITYFKQPSRSSLSTSWWTLHAAKYISEKMALIYILLHVKTRLAE